MEPQAWVTSAVDNAAVDKAIILAGSLRRVCTSKGLAVVTTLAVSEKLRKKLKTVFDMVHVIERNSCNGLSLEDYAKVEVFSILAYDKCVYITPNSLVLQNCDDIFKKYENFAVALTDNDMDTSMFLFSPSLGINNSFDAFAKNHGLFHEREREAFSLMVKALQGKAIPKIEKIGKEYYMAIAPGDNKFRSAVLHGSVVRFSKGHPLEYVKHDGNGNEQCGGELAKFVHGLAMKIYLEDVKNAPVDGDQFFLRSQYRSEPIAVVGMSFRLPGANSPGEFWSLLEKGQNAVVPVPDFRWKREHLYLPCKNRKVEAGFLNVNIDEFDAKFFGLSLKEAEYLDPQQRLLLEVSWEALEEAMIDSSALRGSNTGIFVGSWTHDYKDMLRSAVDFNLFRSYMGNSIASTAARLSHFYQTTGPSIGTESGCSSSFAALDMACKSLKMGDSDFAIAAGVNLLLHSFETSLVESVFSPEYRCKTFASDADGFARAEGCAVILLKRLSDAIKNEDNIWGLIRSTALTQEGVSKSLGTPTIHCESLAMQLAIKRAGIRPKDVSYIEAHGTGTAVGDPMEIKAIEVAYSKEREEPLVIGSVKTNVGHTESVAGLTGLIKVLLSMKNELIPKHLNLETLNPEINLDIIPAQIPLKPVPWPKSPQKTRIAGVSAFGISGTDGHAIVEEPPEVPRHKVEYQQKRPLHIMKVSAKSTESMNELLRKYIQICKHRVEHNEDTEEDFANLAYSANVGRTTLNHRAVVVAKSFVQAEKILEEKSFIQREVKPQGSKLCFLFTGQGSQYPNMAKRLYESSPIFKESFDKCDNVLQQQYNILIKDVLWPKHVNNDDLNRTLFSQTSVFVVEYCLLKLWESWGVKADFVLGHSLGEFAAAVAAGALNLNDALMLVGERSRLIDNLPRGKMLVVKTDMQTVDEAIRAFREIHPEFWVDYAAINSAEQTVVAGDSEMIESFSKFCSEKSLKTIVLAATHAFHSRHMEPILDSYRNVARAVKKLDTHHDRPKYISGMDGKLVQVEDIDADYWVRHAREKVRYMDACKVAHDAGCNIFLEVGPHPVLSALTMMNMEGHQITCLPSIRRNQEEWVTLLDSLSKLYVSEWMGEIDWIGFDRFYNRKKVKLPFYPFNKKPIWAKVEPAYAAIHPLVGSIIPISNEDTFFQSSLTLQNTSFAKDHVIGKTVVFPGAGFLEMCLAGGYSAVHGLTETIVKPRRPILLKSLKILTPLAIHESSVCRMQTVVTLAGSKNAGDAEVSYIVEVNRQTETNDLNTNWIQHASAEFIPVAPCVSTQTIGTHDITLMQTNWKTSVTKDIYEKLPEIGIRYGPKFQSLETAWSSETGMLASIKTPEDYHNYLIHPVIADAMIQVAILWACKGNIKKKLLVPVQINEFVWLKEPASSKLFTLCSLDERGDTYCALIDESGSPLALMKGVEFTETTAKLVESMIAQQSTAMPGLWEVVWKPSRGPLQGSLEYETMPEHQLFTEKDLEHFKEINNIPESEKQFYKNLVNITRLAILKALFNLGWKPDLSKSFSVKGLASTLNIKENFEEYLRFYLRAMTKAEFGLLQAMNSEENVFKFVKNPPTTEEIELGIKHITSSYDLDQEEYKLIKELEKHLDKILAGTINPLVVLFPENPEKPSAAKYYEEFSKKLTNIPLEAKTRMHLLNLEKTHKAYHGPCKPTCRILEVGTGTGAATVGFLPKLIEQIDQHCDCEYIATDISPSFFATAEKNLRSYLKHITFKKYDMEKDPLKQGFCPENFDLICATEVFHIAKDIKKTMKRIRSLLKPGGLIVFEETIHPDETITFVFGLLEGYWQFQDRDFRKDHVTLTPAMWEQVLTESGFHGIDVVRTYDNTHGYISAYANPMENNFWKELNPERHSWIILGEEDSDFTIALNQRLRKVNRNVIMVPKPKVEEINETEIHSSFNKALASALDSTDSIEGVVYLWSLAPKTQSQVEISLPFVSLMKIVSEMACPPKVFAVLCGAQAMENCSVADPFAGTIIGLCKAILNEQMRLQVSFLDLDPNKDLCDQVKELFMNLWMDNYIGLTFRDGLRFRQKVRKGKILTNEPLSLPSGCDRFQLVLPKTRLISDLEFGYLEPYHIKDNEVEVQIKAIALNFRDVFTVLKPIKEFENFNTLGLDYSGVVTKIGRNVTKYIVGDKVVGMNSTSDLSLPSHICTLESRVATLPGNMTFAEGATIPVVFCTAQYCLINHAKIKKGETVLIHTASGGVGLMAIQICNLVGAKVIATAGSTRKRAFLKNLGIQHVFDSRTTNFKDQVLKVTGGRGVNVVLNSITGPGFKEASMDSLTLNGRFIEMSKLNVWTTEDVKSLRPDVYYKLVDLTQLSSEEYDYLMDELKRFVDLNYAKPVPYERFDALNIRGALKYLQSAKHIGKIVCIMPEVTMKKSKLTATTPLFNEDSTYVVTGGLGGIGYEVVKWMLTKGAKHIAILSRSSPKSEKAAQIKRWNNAGKHINVFSVDVGNFEKCKEVFEALKMPEMQFPQVRGVMHAAGVLHSAVLENQTWDSFTCTYNPKVNGSWNLHELTKCYTLEHFVLFSSIAATFGLPGGPNHSASNAFQDSFAAFRRSNGLQATCINWGNWGEVGVAVELDFPGVKPISNFQGLLALETFLTTQTSHIAVMNVDSFSLLVKALPLLRQYIDDFRLLGETKDSTVVNSDEFWNEVDKATSREEKLAVFKNSIKTVLRNILKMDAYEAIDDNAEFATLGVDSLMMLEMKNGMQSFLGSRMIVSANQLKDCNTAELLANRLVDILEGILGPEKKLSRDELRQLIYEDSELLPELPPIEDFLPITTVTTVLLTGATGNLGPYLLRELTQMTQVKQVYCIVRRKESSLPLERLQSRLNDLEIANEVNWEKVEVVDGRLTAEQFGLPNETYQHLCKNIDAIVHSAAMVDHTAMYWKAPTTNENNLRSVNVIGTARLIKFAAQEKVKHIYYASTILAFTGMGKDGEYSEGWQSVSAFDSIEGADSLGYAISKHISEQIIFKATLKGLPIKVFRFPLIAGDSKTGRIDFRQNHSIQRWLACMKAGVMHDIPIPISATPVDYCAKLSLELFFNPDAPMDVFNVIPQQVEDEQVLVRVAQKFKIHLEVVSYPKFIEKLESEGKDSPVAPFLKLYMERQSHVTTLFDNPPIQVFNRYPSDKIMLKDTLRMKKYSQNYDNYIENTIDVLTRDFRYLWDNGVFQKYKIAPNE